MKTILSFAAAAALTLAAALTVNAQPKPVTVGDLTIEIPWTRATPGKAQAGGGFLKITNTGAEADRLAAAQSPRAKRTEIHEMSVKDGIMVMRPLADGLEIPAGETVDLKPGGYHVMFMGLEKPFAVGETIPVTLTFEKAGTVELELTVEAPGAKEPEHTMHHGGGHDSHGAGHGTMKAK